MRNKNQKKGITLVETLISIALFGTLAVISTGIMMDVINLEKKSSIYDVLYEDSRILLQQITNEIQGGAIDYEEYYNQKVIGSKYYGVNYGAYASRFFDPGKSITDPNTQNPDNLGIECSYPKPAPANLEDCEIFYTLSSDLSTGQNPFQCKIGGLDSNPAASNALCDSPFDNKCAGTSNVVDELYLIDNTGTKKTIIARKKTVSDSDYGIAIVRMNGFDLDQNGIVDTFSCGNEFNCFGKKDSEKNDLATDLKPAFYGADSAERKAFIQNNNITVPLKADLSTTYLSAFSTSSFVPLTPLKATITDLKFIINPIEDPYRAFAETSVQQHPTVTIIMTIDLSSTQKAKFSGSFTPITIESTISAGMIGQVPSYPPTKDASWLKDIENGSGSQALVSVP